MQAAFMQAAMVIVLFLAAAEHSGGAQQCNIPHGPTEPQLYGLPLASATPTALNVRQNPAPLPVRPRAQRLCPALCIRIPGRYTQQPGAGRGTAAGVWGG